ncbi:MAG: hypothetical protein ACJ75L_08410 [Gaiellaceae bacterium]
MRRRSRGGVASARPAPREDLRALPRGLQPQTSWLRTSDGVRFTADDLRVLAFDLGWLAAH